MSFTTATDTERKNISVWFECKSCQFTFPFRTVDEFLDHKKQKHLAEFQKAQCIVFEERLQDKLVTNYSGQNSETKLFAQDDEVELCSGVQEIFSGIAELSSVQTLPLPVPVLNRVLPPPVNLSHKDDTVNTAIQTTDASAIQEKHIQEFKNTDFGLFSVCLPSAHNSTVSDPCDLEADLILNDSAQIAVEAHHPVHIIVDVGNNSGIISPDHLSPDFSFFDHHDDKIDVPIEVDAPSNVGYTSNRNFTSPNPYVSLHRLSAKELLASNRSNNLKNTLTKVDIVRGPKACTICSKSCSTKAALALHMNTHYTFKRGRRRFKCMYPDCPSTFDHKCMLKYHIEHHESVSNKQSFIFPLPDNDKGLTEAEPLTLREWLIQQKLTSEKSNNSSEKTETVNIIRLDPDPTEMDEATDKVFKISRETPIKCKLCGKTLESEAEVKVHVMYCCLRNKKRHCYCVPCNKVYSSPGGLKSHRDAKHAEQINDQPGPPQREYKCHICLKPFKAFCVLKNHLVTHKNKEERERDASFVCDTCGKPYFNKNDLARHIVAHSEDRPFKCSSPNCTAAFKFKRFLQDHLKTHLPKPQKVPKSICCPKKGCNKRFTTQKNLRLHLKTIRHTWVSPEPKSLESDRENCGKLSIHEELLERHRIAVERVGGELPTFQCQICNKTFAWRGSLFRHLGSHTGERRFKCSHDGCEKAYRDKKSMNEHIRGKHTGERPFQCELCGKAYHRAICLKVHMGVHRKRKQAELE